MTDVGRDIVNDRDLLPDPELSVEEPGHVVPPPDDPMAVARVFLHEHYERGDDLLLRHHRGTFHRWVGTCWPEDEERRVKSELYHWLEPAVYVKQTKDGTELVPFKPNASKVAEVAHALAAIGHVREALDRPCWLDGTKADGIVAMENGLLRLSTRTVEPHRPTLFNEHALPFAFDPSAPEPTRWLRFLDELWGDDRESVECLAEVMGYVLSGETNQQKIFMLVGPPRSGKGTIGRVLTGLLGAHNVAAPTLAGLTQNFGLQGLIGKPLALISDARLNKKSDGTIAVERLLSISGEDTLTVDRKYKDHWTGRLPSRFLILTNELPRFADASGALASRFVVFVLSKSFLHRENPRLSDELLEEAPSIFNWCLAGLDRLRERGYFREPESSADAMRHLRDLASPVSAFVRDCCEVGSERETVKDDLWAAWKVWCEAEGMPSGTKAVLMRDLRAAHPEVRPKRARRGEERTQVVVGVGLRPARTLADAPDPPDQRDQERSDGQGRAGEGQGRGQDESPRPERGGQGGQGPPPTYAQGRGERPDPGSLTEEEIDRLLAEYHPGRDIPPEVRESLARACLEVEARRGVVSDA